MTVVQALPATVRVKGLSVFAHHGITPDERAHGQRFVFDIDASIDDCVACRSDESQDCVDYAAIVAVVVEVATNFRFRLLEALAEAICLELLAEFPVDRVRLSVGKTAPAIEHTVALAGVEIERTREHLSGG